MKDLNNKKVILNYDKLSKNNLSVRFRNFIESNKDKVFTASLDVDNHYTVMYVLKEDESEIKWLFYLDDLIEV